MQIAFNTDEETGEALVDFPEKWTGEIGALVILGLLEHKDYKIFKLTNKKIVDITLKKAPSKNEIDNQNLMGAENVPDDLVKYYEIAKAFWDLFFVNLKSINGRLYNLENAKFGKWVNPIKLMIETDGVTEEQFREVFKFLKKSEFWKDKVQSTQKLRDKFNTLYNQLKSDEQRDSNNNGQSGVNGKRKQTVSTEYLEEVFRDLQS